VVIQKALSADHDVTLAETNRRGHATRLAQGAAAEGVDVVAVLGGDGTQNEVANGLAGTQTALATLPGGSTNVFARTIGLPNDPIETTGVLLDALAKKSIRRIGLGSVNDRYFLFHTGVGFDAAVVRQVERRDTFKRWFGHPLFIYATVVTWLRHYDRHHPHFAVRFSEGDVPGGRVDDGYFTIVMNTSPYTFLGNRPFDIAPEATFDRGLVAVTVRSLNLGMAWTLARTAFVSPKAVRESRSVDFRTDLESFEVVGHTPFPYQVDGDYLGEIDRLRFRHEPDALSLVIPDPSGATQSP
jgi:diacylglycerol kinase family enzyme